MKLKVMKIIVLLSLAIIIVSCSNTKEQEVFYDNGSLKEKFNVTEDKSGQFIKEGSYTSFYENGKKAEEGSYKEGKRNGEWKRWSEIGAVQTVSIFENGFEMERTFFHSYPDKISQSIKFKENPTGGIGEYGHGTSFYENGQKQEEGNFENGKEEGEWKVWLQNGQLASIITYQSGIKQKRNFYNKDKKTATAIYEQGEISELKLFDREDNLRNHTAIKEMDVKLSIYDKEVLIYDKEGNKIKVVQPKNCSILEKVSGENVLTGTVGLPIFRTGKHTWGDIIKLFEGKNVYSHGFDDNINGAVLSIDNNWFFFDESSYLVAYVAKNNVNNLKTLTQEIAKFMHLENTSNKSSKLTSDDCVINLEITESGKLQITNYIKKFETVVDKSYIEKNYEK